VFPHRGDELRSYRDYISQLFASLPVNHHSRVFNYDKAVRLRVSQTRCNLLSDHSSFTDLSLLWLQAPSWSAEPSSSRVGGTAKQGSNRRREPCRRFNEKKCPNTTETCTYKHICSNCKSNAHGKSDCTFTVRTN
jgi:hypothetical protein